MFSFLGGFEQGTNRLQNLQAEQKGFKSCIEVHGFTSFLLSGETVKRPMDCHPWASFFVSYTIIVAHFPAHAYQSGK